MSRRLHLRAIGRLWVLCAFASGVLSATLWFTSTLNWERFLTRSYVSGFAVYETLRTGVPSPAEITVDPLGAPDSDMADAGRFERITGMPRPAYVTNVSVFSDGPSPFEGANLTLAIVSDRLNYPVSSLSGEGQVTAAEKFGRITRLLAKYCGEPLVVARLADGPWRLIDGRRVWGCDAAPRDNRILALLLAAVALGILLSQVGNIAASFQRFAAALATRHRVGGPESYESTGPAELQEIVDAVNANLAYEREQLSRRAFILSGVSHDLGTPATRLKLRAALIDDPDLRRKFEADIDQMTGYIESALTYTRAELNIEEPRAVSLASLVQSVVDDYADTGRPVVFDGVDAHIVEGLSSVFSTSHGSRPLLADSPVLVTARPISLTRALTNLIDNALKYGRRATVSISIDAETAVVIVEDQGSHISVEDIERSMAPFQRGENAGAIDGFGLGLTIVETVANQHGGSLVFERGQTGLRARLAISRR